MSGGRAPSEYDLYLFHEGTNYRCYRVLGAHPAADGGVWFAVWAPHAAAVRVVGDFNGWRGERHALRRLNAAGVWALLVPEARPGQLYKYEIHTGSGQVLLKADPFAFEAECRPGTASRIAALSDYVWGDAAWRNAAAADPVHRPVFIYEVHAGSWRRHADGSFLSYRELADALVPYVAEMGFTHIELLPLAEHPLDASWGYQVTGFYAVTSRYGSPQDFMYFVDRCHQAGIGVIMDWVPGHFCRDDHGLRRFDGTALYEDADPRRGDNPQWGTANFNFARREVWSFLIANAVFWLDVYHIDGLRLDAVANMLYLDYGKGPGQWLPNEAGGRENLAAAAFLRRLNQVVRRYYPTAITAAEESTTWPRITAADEEGLGFTFKWNMGWMNDMLRYMRTDPLFRRHMQNNLTFSLMYAFAEHFILPLSHDEVVHGKRSLLDKMPGDYWRKFANLRALYGYMAAHPGKKLLFMGGEFGQFVEWRFWSGLDWLLLRYDMHARLRRYVRDLAHFYRQEPALWEQDDSWQGFYWLDCQDAAQSVVAFVRRGAAGAFLIVACNFTPVVRYDYRLGVPAPGRYEEVFNSDRAVYGGSGQENVPLTAQAVPWHGQTWSLTLKLPPLAVVYLRLARETNDRPSHN